MNVHHCDRCTWGSLACRHDGYFTHGTQGTIAELIMKHEPTKYRKYIWHNKKGKHMLYVQHKKSFYCTLQTALLFRKLLLDTLISWCVMINPYNQCVANKVINGRPCSIIRRVDDLKILHLDKNVVEDII